MLEMMGCNDNSSANGMFYLVNDFLKKGISWKNDVGLTLDNVCVNMGRIKGLKKLISDENQNVYVQGCLCHLINLCIEKGLSSLSVDPGYLVSVIFNSKTMAQLKDFCEFCGIENGNVLKHVATRWPSLEKVVRRVLDQLPALKSYAASQEQRKDPQWQRLKMILCDPKTELYLLFVNSTLPPVVQLSTFLQQEQSILQKVIPALTEFFKKLLSRFIKPDVLATSTVLDVDVDSPSNYLGSQSLFIGFTANQYISSSALTPRDVNKFYTDVMDFCVAAACYFQKKMPVHDPILKEAAQILDVPKRMEITFNCLETFMAAFPSMIAAETMDQLLEEFNDYQTLQDTAMQACYFQKKMPVHDPILKEAAQIPDVPKRMEITFNCLETFMAAVPSMIAAETMEQLLEEFDDYQTLQDTEMQGISISYFQGSQGQLNLNVPWYDNHTLCYYY
ncbi:UNVERIFIED_CONTAM: hypothetical protein FKN15_036420 [Acipenser sinensis]